MAHRLNPKALQAAKKALQTSNVSKVGWFSSSKYEDGTPVAYIAAIQEFGYPAGMIPRRSFIRTTISEKRDEWNKIIKNAAKQTIMGKMRVDQILELIGLKASGDMRKKISRIKEPPLTRATLRARKRRGNSSKKPLVDTGYMLATLNNRVEGE